jgi:hypothetical protein
MRRDSHRGMTGVLGMVLVLLLASSAPVQAGYTEPGQSGSLMGEVSAFLGDFGQWNAYHGGLPMQLLQMVPAAEETDAIVLLFWLWLHDPLPLPVGSMGMGQNGNGPPSDLPGGGGTSLGLGDPPPANNPPSSGGDPGLGGNGSAPTADPVSAPSGFTLMAVGSLGLLVGWRLRSRKWRSKELKQLASLK